MAIELKTCKCGCGYEFLGTARRLFYDARHKAHWHRQNKKTKDKK
ncbi:hypothetical protein NVP1275O_45 [Vibrio phage 1.275.O._10N.286.54.E11]|nr:hypothetical protein NVP1275O_45 [Vibrio phage 1.275.O._10N.286.54.E11]